MAAHAAWPRKTQRGEPYARNGKRLRRSTKALSSWRSHLTPLPKPGSGAELVRSCLIERSGTVSEAQITAVERKVHTRAAAA